MEERTYEWGGLECVKIGLVERSQLRVEWSGSFERKLTVAVGPLRWVPVHLSVLSMKNERQSALHRFGLLHIVCVLY